MLNGCNELSSTGGEGYLKIYGKNAKIIHNLKLANKYEEIVSLIAGDSNFYPNV